MKKPTIFKTVLAVLMILLHFSSYSQNLKSFTPRFDKDLKGDMLLIGNNILNRHVDATKKKPEIKPEEAYDDNGYNSDFDMQYIDIDGDASTFSSSSANLAIPNPACYKIVYAGLYWGAILQSGSRTAINQVKLKLPTAGGSYNDITGQVIYDANSTPIGTDNNKPYACYADVTALLTNPLLNPNPQGTYTVANVTSSLGGNGGTGLSAGWSLFIVYEDPSLPAKSITSFEGFSGIGGATTLDIPVSGFRTIPAGPVRTKFAFAALEGDKPISGDYLTINGTTISASNAANVALRATNNFFNSSITYIDPATSITADFMARVPPSKNTLGFDTGILNISNPSNSVIANSANSATIRLGSTQDVYFYFFNAIALEIIEPKIILTKVVQNVSGADIGNSNVTLGQELFYNISFQNKGNDDVTGFTIKDKLPININFDPADIILPNGSGITYVYDAAAREILFTIPDNLVNINDARYEIKFKVQVVPNCNDLSDACSDKIQNQAFATYKGTYNQTQITDDPSLSFFSDCYLGTPAATNFLVGVDSCKFTKSVILCGASVDLVAANGYSSYSWSKSPTGSPVIGTSQTLTVTQVGTYYVHDTAVAPCLSIDQTVTVSPFGTAINNPVIPFADQVDICPNNNKKLPNIFLCGANATRLIRSGINDALSIVWEKLNEGSCTASANSECANENAACTWAAVGAGQDYTANTAGQFRMTINYGGGCFNRFYFNVYQNLLDPTVTTKDIICNTQGEITVGGVPAGYEYSLDNVTYQLSNVFPITTQNSYTVFIKQIGVSSFPCLFSVPGIQIRKRDFTVSTFITQPYCNGGKGSVKLAANDVQGQYYYKIYQGGILVNQVGPIAASDYTFSNLNAGTIASPITYTWDVSTEDGCHLTGTAALMEPAVLTATSALTVPVTCTDGEITVTPVGGTPPFAYFVNSSTNFQSIPQIVVSSPLPPGGIYNITVVDNNNCTTTTSITVNATPPPAYTIAKTDVLCSGSDSTGSITVNVSNPNGNSMRYSIDNGVTFVNSPAFTGLASGNYDVVVEFKAGVSVCLSAPQTITINAATPIAGTATLTTPYTCNGAATITVSGVSGGTSPYNYSINGINFQPGMIFSGLSAGTYTVKIKDNNGCTVDLSPITVASLNGPTDLTFTYKSFNCSDNTSAFNVNWPSAAGGKPPIRFQIVALPSFIPVGSVLYNYLTAEHSDGQYSGVPAGLYTFQVTDGNDCKYQEIFNLVPEPPIAVTGTLLNNVKCFNTATGSIKFDVLGTFSSGKNVYSYDITGPLNFSASGQTAPTITLTNLPAGDYTITAIDKATGCKYITTVTVAQAPAALTAPLTATPITCLVNGSVTVNATGGWGSYSYTLTPPSGPVVGPQLSNTFTNLSLAGNYTISTTDLNGCLVTSIFTLTTPVPPTATISATSDLCYDVLNMAKIVVAPSGGIAPYEYSINNGSSWQSGNTFADLIPGSYTIIVRDAYGCTFTLPAKTIAPQLTVNRFLTKGLDCSGSPNAIITGAVTGGYPDFSYQVNFNGGAYSAPIPVIGSGFTYSAASAGTYQFQITDANNCSVETFPITISPLVPITVATTATDPTCNGFADGSVQLIPSGGSGGYSYSNDGGATYTGTSLYLGLSAGPHTFYVKDSKNCSVNITVTLGEPTAVVASATIPVNTACSTTTVITAAGAGGAGGYSYSFNGSSTYTTVNTLSVTNSTSAQTITYSVQDSKGCIDTKTISIPAYNPPTGIAFSGLTTITCLAPTTSVTLTPTVASGTGVSPFTYLITAGPGAATSNNSGASTGIFTGLLPGNYTFQVTDGNGCKASASLPIAPAAVIAVSGSKTDIKCFGSTDGTATFTITGASSSGNYTYTLNPASGVITAAGNVVTVTGLGAGTYTFNVVDKTTGCTSNTASVTIDPATAIVFTVASTKVNCNNKISIISFPTLSGGIPGYTYAFVTAGAPAPAVGAYSASTMVDTAVLGLSIDVYVKDNNDCTAPKQTILIGQEVGPTINTPASQCYTGTPIAITITGTTAGTASYSIDNITYGSSSTFNLGVGTYTLYIKDEFGCTAQTTYEVKPQLTITAIAAADTSCTPDTTITLTATGGTGSYTYSVSNGGPYALASNPYITATAGTYTFKVTDTGTPACSALSTDIIVKTKATVLTISTSKTDVKCFGDATGIINITPTSGKAPYTYSVTKAGLPISLTATTTGLVAGTYDIVVTDALGCTSPSTPITIGEPTLLTASAIAPATTTCSTSTLVTVNGAGGTTPYFYSINGGAFTTTNTLTINDNGTDQIIAYQVRDANGCTTASQDITVKKLNPPVIGIISGTAITCNVGENVSDVTISATNGLAPLAFVIVSGPTVNITGATDGKFTGLASGTYLFKVTDANGCSDTKSYTVDPVTPIAIIGQNISNVLCNGGSTGIAKYTVSGFSATGNYIVGITTAPAGLPYTSTQSGDVIILSDLGMGSYKVTVTDKTTGCSEDDTVAIIQPSPLTLVLTGNVNANCNVATSKVTVTAGGGTSGYNYAFMQNNVAPGVADYGPSFVANLNPTTNLNWDVWVKDAKGCETKLDVIIAKDPMPTVSASVQNQCAATGSSFVINAVGAAGVGPYTYTINTGVAPTGALADTFTVAPGTYIITVKDANSCTNTTTVTVNSILTASAILTKDITCSPAPTDATITINAGGGNNTSYTYEVSSDGGVNYSTVGLVGNVFTTSSPGTFLFEVTDANGCTKVSNPITINPKVDPKITSLDQIQDIYCNGEATASIKVNIDASKGIGPFTYSIDGTNFQSSDVFSGLVAGNYTVTVKDSKGCPDTEDILITQPDALNYTLTKKDLLCSGPPAAITLGSVTVDVGTGLGGTAPYTYILTNNVGAPTQIETNNPGTANYTFTALNYGTYSVSVVDANGCTLKDNIQVTSPPDDLVISVQATASCAAGGTVKVTAGGALLGNGPFYFAIYQKDAVFGLYPGVPTVTAGVPDPPYIAEDAPGAPYTATFTGLTQGVIYSFIVYDSATGCSYIKQATTPTTKATSLATLRVVTDVTCKGAGDGTVSITLNVEPTAPPGYIPPTTIDYVVYNSQTNLPIDPANQDSGLSVGAYPYSLPLIGGLSPGSYYVVITEHGGTNDGCSSATLPFDIYESATDLTVNALVVKADNCKSEAGQIVATAQGGTTVSRDDPLAVPAQVSAPVPYQYQILPDTGVIGDASDDSPPMASDANWKTDNFFEKDSGNYIVYAMDANKCIKPFPITLGLDPSPAITLGITDKCAVEGAFEIVVNEATAGVAPYSISMNGSAYQNFSFVPGTPNFYTISNLNSGTYDITVQDANGCTDLKSITIYKPLELTPAITALPTCADNDGVITLTGTGGTSSYTYSISPMPVGVSIIANVISGLPAGTYTVTMTDTASPIPCTTTASVTLSSPTVVTFSTVVASVSCNGSSDGIITVNLPATNDNPVYTYAISPIPLGSVQTANVFSQLPAGTYTITVSSGRGCSTSDTNVIVGAPLPLSATAAITDYACSGNIPQPAKVTVNVTAGTGTGPYQYNFDGSANYYDSNELYVVDNAALQTIHFYVKDFNGCLFNDQVDVNPYKKITDINFNPLTQPTCPIPFSNVQLVVAGGYPITKYEIVFPVPFDNGNADTFMGLSPNTTYLFKVTDANGCSFQKSFITSKLTPIAIVGELVNDISCNVANGLTNNGTAIYTVTGFSSTGNYTVAVTTTPGGLSNTLTQVGDVITLSDLSAGSYTIVVVDKTTGCTQNATVDITNPAPITFTAAATKVYCSKEVSEITVSGVTGGTGAYTYAVEKTGDAALEVYSGSNILTVDTNLADLSWDVYVKDANGCVSKNMVAVVYDAPPAIIVPDQQCFTGGNLTVDLNLYTTVHGGAKAYTLNGSDLASSTATFTAPGTYKLGIRDDNGCEAFVDYTIQNQLSATASLTKDLYCVGAVAATIAVVVKDGVGPYSSQMYSGIAPLGSAVGTAFAGSSFTASVATAGDYYFVTTDSNTPACTVTTTKVTVNAPVPTVIVSTPILQPVLCTGGTATMQVNVDNTIGLAPYTYTVTKTGPIASAPVIQVSNNLFTGLSAGTYDITVTDVKGCVSATTSMPISEPVALTATINPFPVNTTCNIATVITVVGHDGTPTGTGTGYYYNFNNEGYTTTNTYTVNDNGLPQSITYSVKDANGCVTTDQTVIVNPLSKPTNLDFTPTAITCKPGENSSTVSVKATSGVGALSFEILSTNSGTASGFWGPLTTAGSATAASFPGLLPGDYTFQVTDSNGCSYQELFTVKDVVKIAASGQLIAGVACKSEANGKVTFTVSGFSAGGFTSTFTGISGAAVSTPIGTDTFELTNLVTGTYRIDVMDNTTGCVSNFSVFVPEPIAAVGVSYVTVKNANCNVGAQIKATANDGTPGYKYAFVKAGDPIVYTNGDTAILDPAFTWVLWTKDAHNCEVSMPIAIISDPLPTVTVPVLASNQCNLTGTPYTFTITSSTGIAPLTYSIDGISFQSGTSFIVTAPGTYNVTVKDGNGCMAISPTSITIYPPLGLTTTITALPSCANNDGVITVNATGGSAAANYRYTLLDSASNPITGPQVSNVFSTLAAGSYNVKVADLITTCEKITPVVLSVPTPVNFSASDIVVNNVSCNGDSNGIITVNLPASNNNPVYKYEIAGPVTVGPQTSNVFAGLAAGTYVVTVTSGRGCSAPQTVVIAEPLPLSVSGSVYECPTDNTFNTAVVSITAVGGTTGYAYSTDGVNYFASNTSAIVATMVAQTITIYVKDANGCTATNTVVVDPLPTQTVSQTTAITCTNDETVTITGTGGTGPFTYQSSPVGASNVVQDASLPNVFHISQPGTYYFQVDDTATGCTITTLPYVVAPFNTINVVATATKPLICYGDASGALEVNVTGYAGTYDYKVVGSSPLIAGSGNTTINPLIISGLSGGSYTIEVTETASPFCVNISNTVTIISPDTPLVVVANETASVTCTNDKGAITAVGSGGWGSLEYELVGPGAGVSVPYSGNATFANLTAGNYTVNVKDANGCIVASNPVQLSVPAPINGTFTPSTLLLSCFGNTDASITVSNVIGGQGSNYSYTLNAIAPTAYMSGPQSSPVFGGLGAGTYTVTITDGYSCSTSSANIIIAQPAEVVANLVVASTQTCLIQTQLTLSAVGGTPPYTYSADGISYGATTFNSSVTFPVGVGTYHYYVKDLNNCVGYLSNDIKIDPLPSLVINLDKSNAVVNCAGDNTGVIVATAQGGLGNYSYTLMDGLGTTILGPQASGNFTGLFAGNYQIKVNSGDCATVSPIITITQPATPLIAPYTTKDVVCNGAKNGQITVTASGGTGIIKYAISPRLDQFFDSGIFIDLQPGSYDVIAQDKNGCYVYITGIVISEPNPIVPSLTAGSMLPEICFGDKDGAFSIDIVGGTMPYNVSLDNANGVYTTGALTQTQFDFTGLTGGTHTVYIKDANGCTIEFIVVMPESVKINPIATVDYGCVNNSASNSVTVAVDASITDLADLDYSLNGAPYQTSNVFTNVTPGTGQFIDVRHTNGCTQRTPTFDVLQVDPLALVLSDGGLNEIVATATGGGGGYQYTFNGESNGTKNTFIIYKSGDYTVEVTDSNGCVAKATRNFKYIDVCVPNYFTPNGDGVSDGWAPGCTINYKDLTFDIFDRYGRRIATYRLGQYWDGKYNGAELPSGDYWYVLKLNDLRDAREFVGHFTLYR